MTQDELKSLFKGKKRKIERKTNKNGLVKESITEGFEVTTFEQFQNWFNLEEFKKGCSYCKLTNEQSLQLYNAQRNGLRMDGTRGGKRGRRLELDRRDPNLSYDNLENLVWCCYWCNNAKSNFFSAEEFIPIGKEIGNSLKIILQELNQ
jgi:hypothetical protein